MYPSLLLSERFPTRLRGLRGACSPQQLSELLTSFGVIARVRIKTTEAEYPLRRQNYTIWPLGEFTTTLAGPDLLPLLARGEVLKVYEHSLYDMGRPFEGAMRALLAERQSAQARGDVDGQTFAKLLANSLAGKLAQRSGKWVRAKEDDQEGAWGEWTRLSSRTKSPARMRHLAGLAWRYDASEEHRGPHTSAFSYLTAYGRQLMARIRACCPERTVVSQDTDGVWVCDSALARLRESGTLAGEGPGRLRIVGSVDSAQFWGPRHYRAGSRWVLSGMGEAVVDADSLTVLYSSRAPLFAALPFGAPRSTLTHVREAGMPARQDAGRVQPDGWILPPHIIQSRQPGE